MGNLQDKSSEDRFERFISALGSLWQDPQAHNGMRDLIDTLDTRYDLQMKIASEDGVQNIIEQMVGQ